MLEQLINNWICWVILALALFCYQQIWLQWFCRHSHVTSAGIQKEFSAILINTLPLLGLFGTIVGLLDCFSVLAQSGVKGELVSQGIADALITTQLGLVCAIPAWLMHYWLLPTRIPHINKKLHLIIFVSRIQSQINSNISFIAIYLHARLTLPSNLC